MKNIKAIVMFSMGAGLMSHAAIAAWSQPMQIAGYYVYDTGNAYFRTSSDPQNTGCTDNRYIGLDPDAKNFKAIWAQIISAHAQGLTVSVQISGCIGIYPRAVAIAVPNVW